MNALTPLQPALQTLTPLGLPASFQEWYAAANAQQAQRLAAHLAYEFEIVAGLYADRVDHDYLCSDAFRANVVQAVRAAEVAESEEKLRFIARALAGCLLSYQGPRIDKFQTLRLTEALSDREIQVFTALFDMLGPLEPDRGSLGSGQTVAGLSRDETRAALLGLGQLGLVRAAEEGWQLTPLAGQLAALTRLPGQSE